MTVFDIVIRFFLEGGFFMYPVLLVAALGTAVVIERVLVITRAAADGETLWRQVRGHLAEGRMDEAVRICQSGTRPIFTVLLAGATGKRGNH